MKFYRSITLLSLLALSACGPTAGGIESTPTVSTAPTNTQAASVTPVPQITLTDTVQPTPLPSPTIAVSATIAVTATVAASATPAPAAPPTKAYPYLDDRSTAPAVIQSYFNAINRKEYARAYGYWSANADPGALAPFDSFQKGYAETATVDLTLGATTGDVGAGQLYYSVAALLKAKATTGANQTYSACYNLHLSRPDIQGVPPFAPLAIESAAATLAPSGATDTGLLAHACDKSGRATQPISPSPITKSKDVSATNYLDDRSDAPEVLYSLFNAVNRHEYVRAYSYWEPSSSTSNGVAAFDVFQKGYEKTGSVKITLGKVVMGAAAGNTYYTLPIVIQATTTSGEAQTYAGCYRLHQGNPSIQAMPPSQPIAIQAALVKQVANGSDLNQLLSQACATQP